MMYCDCDAEVILDGPAPYPDAKCSECGREWSAFAQDGVVYVRPTPEVMVGN